MSSPISYLFAALLSLFYFNFHGSKANFVAPQNCPITNCGNLTFHYPFWKMEEDSTAHDQYCGYPGFGLKCSDSGETILDLPNNDSFYVKEIDFTLSTITLVDTDVVNQKCPRATHSMSVGTLPLGYSPLDVNLSFYFNCTSPPDPFPGVPPTDPFPGVPPTDPFPSVPPIMCWGLNGTNRSYVFKEGEEPEGIDWSENCDENVVVTVKETEEITRSHDELTSAFGVAMKNGFVLNWSVAKECRSCEANGGFCGYNNTALEVLCFCGDDTYSGTTSNGLCRKVKKGTRFHP